MPQQPEGRVVTFHSFAGGSGRTMATANTAWILAAAGHRVLVADWDLESPGLHRYLHPFLHAAELERSGGVTELFRRFERATIDPFAVTPPVPVHWPHFAGGIDYLPAGRQDAAYAGALGGLGGLDWDDFYRAGGGEFLDALRRHMIARYDWILIDSPPGVGDLAQICLAHLPDDVFACFTLSAKSIEGAARAAAATRDAERPPRVLPVPMRVDPADRPRAEAGRRAARERLAGLPAGLSPEELEVYWRDVQVPYQSAYAYEETLATLMDLPGQPDSLLTAYERLVWYLTDGAVKALPPLDEGVRYRAAAHYLRLTATREDRVLLRHAPEDSAWAEWITATLASAGVSVVAAGLADADADADGRPAPAARELAVIGDGPAAIDARRRPASHGAGRPPLAVYTEDIGALPAYPEPTSVRLHGLPEARATRELLALVGQGEQPPVGTLRYPGREPAHCFAPPRPRDFLGRRNELARLRQRLRAEEYADPRQAPPVVLHGLDGAGKSVLALEYVHRFRTAYDLVWWLDCGALEEGLPGLARALGVPGTTRPASLAAAVLGRLRRGEPYRRWLVVLDDADEHDQVRDFLPQGPGQVLITSRNLSWGGGFDSVPVGVFNRDESLVYLGRRLPELPRADIDALAEAAGDLPLALAEVAGVVQAGREPTAELVARARRGELALPATERRWDRELARLAERSPGGHRLLQLFSVLGTQTATDLVYSDVMAEVLNPYEASVTDRLMPATLVQQISRLGLLRPDLPGGHIQVHPLVQRVVRARMSADELREARHQVHLVLAGLARRHDVEDPRSWPRYEMLWPHLAVTGAATCREEAVRGLIVDHVRRMRYEGRTAAGQELAHAAERAWAAPGYERRLLQMRGVRAALLRDQGRYAEALALNEQVVAEQARLLGPEHPATLTTRNRLAADLRGLGRFDRALDVAGSTYRAWARTVGAEHAQTLDALTALATAYRAAGRYRAARRCDERVRAFRPFPGPEHYPAALRTAAGVARDLRDAGRFADSVELLHALVPAVAAMFGERSRAALTVRTSLGVSLRDAGRAGEAAPLLEEAYEHLADLSGPAGPDTLTCRHSWGLALLATGHVERARAELAGVERRYRDLLGARHPRTVTTRANLALVAWAAGERADARRRTAEAAADAAAVLPEHHPHALAVALNAALLRAGGDPAADAAGDGAAGEVPLILPRLARAFGPDHPWVRAAAAAPPVPYPTVDALWPVDPC